MNSFLSNYYRKTIRLTPDGFSLYSISDATGIQCEEYPNSENALITNIAPRFFNFDSESHTPIDVIVATHTPVLIPDILYDDSKAKEYLQLQFDVSQFGQHYSDQLGRYHALYFLTQNKFSTVNELNCIPHIKSETSLFYRFLTEQPAQESAMVSVNENFVDLLIIKNNEPMLVNRSTHMDTVDILYYIVNSLQQMCIESPALYLQYFGKPNKKLNELLSKYVNNITIL